MTLSPKGEGINSELVYLTYLILLSLECQLLFSHFSLISLPMISTYGKKVVRVLTITLILNLIVCAAKLIYGIITKSLSLEADGFHSLLDSSSNIVGLIGIYLASRPADVDHPYGHRKIEAIASMGISLLLFITCYEIITSVISRIQNPITPHISVLSFIIIGGSVVINYFVATYEKKKGDLLKSDILVADSIHTRTDIFVSLSVIVSFIAVMLGMPIIDIVIASGIVIFIVIAAFRILSGSVNTLLDAQLIDPTEIEKIVTGIPGVSKCHKIRSHGTRSGIFVDLHIHVNPKMKTEDSHELTHQVVQKIKEKLPEVIEVLIHAEPFR